MWWAEPRVNHDEKLNEPLVQRSRETLDDECVGATHRFFITNEDLSVGEVAHSCLCESDTQLLGYFFGKFRMCATGDKNEVLFLSAAFTGQRESLSSFVVVVGSFNVSG